MCQIDSHDPSYERLATFGAEDQLPQTGRKDTTRYQRLVETPTNHLVQLDKK